MFKEDDAARLTPCKEDDAEKAKPPQQIRVTNGNGYAVSSRAARPFPRNRVFGRKGMCAGGTIRVPLCALSERKRTDQTHLRSKCNTKKDLDDFVKVSFFVLAPTYLPGPLPAKYCQRK